MTEVVNVDFKEQIKLLRKIQVIDTRIYSLEKEKDNIPLKLKEAEDAFTKQKEKLTQLEGKGLDLHKQRKEKELELASKEEEAKKMQTQLYQLKTNKEYSAKLKEIEGAKADSAALEDKILVFFDETDKLKNEINKEKEFLQEEEKKNIAEKQKLDLRAKEIEDKLAQLRAQRDQVARQINPEIFRKYEKILENRDYLAIVKVEGNACQGCFMKVSHQVINLIKMYDNLVACEVCQRILYIEDDFVV
ncbi:MAG: C4-type zinc ribbon domain-containing protein [Candidatus Omnitrophota bacterium]